MGIFILLFFMGFLMLFLGLCFGDREAQRRYEETGRDSFRAACYRLLR